MKFTILTACHNDRLFIEDAEKSVRKQRNKFPDLEWVIVDDCSTDGSREYLSSLQDPWIHLLQPERQLFCSAAYALSLENASGDVCGVLDGDDVLSDGAVRRIVEVYEAHPALVHIYTQNYWCNRNLEIRRKGLSSIPAKGKSFAEISLRRRHCYSHWRTFRRSVSKKVTIFPKDLKCAVDKNMGFALEEAGPGGFLPECLYYYRYYKGNMSTTKGGTQHKTWLDLARKRHAHRLKKRIKVYGIQRVC